MYAIRNVDARFQEVQATTAKCSYVDMKLAQEMMQANTEGHPALKSYMIVFSDQLPTHGHTKLPTGKHAEIFGDDFTCQAGVTN